MSATTGWRTWGRTERATPSAIIAPADAAAIVDIVGRAAFRGGTVKPVGAGHSFTPIAVTTGIQLDLCRLSGLFAVDVDQRRVTLGAGTRLADVPALIGPYGLAMTNLGDIDRQTVAGAISTGTHGTGSRFGGLATQVVAMEMITGTGEMITISEADHPELLDAARVGLGALGVLTAVTLQCVPAFVLAAQERPEPLDEVLDTFAGRCDGADHFEFYWFPHTTTALTKINTRLPAGSELAPLPPARRFIDDTLVANELLRLLCAVQARLPAITPSINRTAGRVTGNRSFTDLSHRVFTTSRRVRFREMEYALPRSAVPDALRAVARLITDRGMRISFPIEVRSAAADPIWLSTAHGRETGYIAVHRYWRDADTAPYFDAVERIMLEHDGRPHWGKLHGLTARRLAACYPRFDDFRTVREDLDPQRVFGNDYLDRVLD
ncbi:D-arabinono-1,4-lactone oxidase [Microlunatus soli]|uniref:FAD-linked oxidoreductase n=1 Tax=Microlunatus soli TaxID=630515 RepID=A0A1H1YFV2_9ACTN|nr:D-arabinono-1,4-lactone oxidase [Microlunatus soli]SDT20251.1 FAD-linked oxidoreductase [Microlunatus soli]